jgi:hypothetical protein
MDWDPSPRSLSFDLSDDTTHADSFPSGCAYFVKWSLLTIHR